MNIKLGIAFLVAFVVLLWIGKARQGEPRKFKEVWIVEMAYTMTGLLYQGGTERLPNVLRLFAAVLFTSVFFGSAARAEVECFPHCDYWHDYGPYDFTYKRPGLFGYPICDVRGNCAPYLRYTYQRGYAPRKSITIRVRPSTSRVR